MQKQTINKIDIAYERHGAGTPLVLIHGFPLDHTCWEALASQLEGQADLIMPDLRGMGQSGSGLDGAPQGAYTVADLAADIADCHSVSPAAVLAGLRGRVELYLGNRAAAAHVSRGRPDTGCGRES